MKKKKRIIIIASIVIFIVLFYIVWCSEIPEKFGCGKKNQNIELHVVDCLFFYGYADVKGNIKIRPKFIQADEFSEGLARVRESNGYGYIDKSGMIVIKSKYDFIDDFHEGLAVVTNGKEPIEQLSGAINKKGKLVLPLKYRHLSDFSEGLAAFEDENCECGYIDKTGKIIISPRFESAGDFKNGIAEVIINGTVKKIDNQGNIIEEVK